MSRKYRTILLVPAVLALVALGAGCGKDQKSVGPTSTGTQNTVTTGGAGLLSVQLQATGLKTVQNCYDDGGHWIQPDSSKLIRSLSLTFGSIRAYPAEVDSDSTSGHPWEGHHGDPDSGAKYIEVLTGPITVDASRLADTLTATLSNANLPVGKYSHLALTFTTASAVLVDSQTVVVHILPQDSLTRILVPFTVATGQTTEIQITLNLNRAAREIPIGSGEYYLSPVLGGKGIGPHDGGPGGFGGGHGEGPGAPPDSSGADSTGWGHGGPPPGHGDHGGGPGGNHGGRR